MTCGSVKGKVTATLLVSRTPSVGSSAVMYRDGSWKPHVLSELARASLAAASHDGDENCTALDSGTVTSTIAQTSVAAEWCAAAVVALLATDSDKTAGLVDERFKPLAVAAPLECPRGPV